MSSDYQEFKKIRGITNLKIEEVVGDELPHRVELVRESGQPVYGAGITLGKALTAAFGVIGIRKRPGDLAAFIAWNFNGGENWVRAIAALETAGNGE